MAERVCWTVSLYTIILKNSQTVILGLEVDWGFSSMPIEQAKAVYGLRTHVLPTATSYSSSMENRLPYCPVRWQYYFAVIFKVNLEVLRLFELCETLGGAR